jgi:hypothetical protein
MFYATIIRGKLLPVNGPIAFTYPRPMAAERYPKTPILMRDAA